MISQFMPSTMNDKYQYCGIVVQEKYKCFRVRHKLLDKYLYAYCLPKSDVEEFVKKLNEAGIQMFDAYAEELDYIILESLLADEENDEITQLDCNLSRMSYSYKKERRYKKWMLMPAFVLLLISVLFLIRYNVLGYRICKDPEVDLGLSVNWASCNLGADNPEESGCYYAWGEIHDKEDYSEKSYLFSYNNVYKDLGDDISNTENDAATMRLGNGWRMPTKAEMEELLRECRWTERKYMGINGFVVTGPNHKSIFLPDSGHMEGESHYGLSYYWTSTFHDEPERNRKCNAWNLGLEVQGIEEGDHVGLNHIYQRRYVGRLIRPVKDK